MIKIFSHKRMIIKGVPSDRLKTTERSELMSTLINNKKERINKNKQMKKIFLITVLFLISTSFFGQTTVILDQPETGNQNHCATYKIHFLPGYSYTPLTGERMHAYISPDCGTHVLLKNTLDGGYYDVYNREIRFQYDEEYETILYKKLAYTIYDKDKNVIGGVDINGVSLVTGSQLLSNTIGENKFELNLFSLSLTTNEYYTLEVTNDKKEMKALKFKVYN